MATAWIELRGSDVFCSLQNGSLENRLPIDKALTRLRDWGKRYDLASRRDRENDLLSIGREMFAWLDQAGWASQWCLGAKDRELEIRVPGTGSENEVALLDAPWELLSTERGPLAQDPLQLFIVSRRIGPSSEAWQPHYGDMQLMFMAAAVEGQSLLDFEAEEAAILEATRRGRTHLTVEETGALDQLGERLTSDEGPFEALHLSCHGDIDPKRGAIVLLETLEGGPHKASPGDLVEACGPTPPPLIVLSACRTAERDDTFSASFARQMVTVVANVVGWDGSVYDPDAIEFAAEFYAELGRRSSVPRAAAHARRALWRIRAENPQRGLHWHLARVYLGADGGGPLCAAGKPLRRQAADSFPRAFLDKARGRVPVASREAFVGRRRTLQAILRSFRDGPNGVLIHGMGALGKSSAAARIANRLSMPTCVIFERYDSLSIFDAVMEMLPPSERRTGRDKWRGIVQADSAALADALEACLAGPFDDQPILLIVDDLERILERPAPGDMLTEVQGDYRAPLGAILKAFARTPTRSRLLLTSRYDFTLPDGLGGDLAGEVVRHPLIAMPERERVKQLRAAERIAGRDAVPTDARAQALLQVALGSAGGNPGLQAALTKPILSGELEAAEKALEQIAYYNEKGVPPAEIEAMIRAGTAADSSNALIAFLARVSFQTYRDALTEDEARQLAAATVFSEGVPIPHSALRAAGAALGCATPERAIERLLALGLFDDWGRPDGTNAYAAANALARPLAGPLDRNQRTQLAKAVLPEIAEAWQLTNGYFPPNRRGLEVARLALDAEAEPALLEAAVYAGAAWLERITNRTREALSLMERALRLLPPDFGCRPTFLRLGVECADVVDAVKLRDEFLARPMAAFEPSDLDEAINRYQLDLRRGEFLIKAGLVDEGENLTRAALAFFKEVDDEEMIAVSMGQIADILMKRDELDEALRIRLEEELPVYERRGASRLWAVTMGQIADIHFIRSEFDEAMRIREEEELPIYEQLGLSRERALTLGEIAAIHRRRDEFEEELKARYAQLPLFEEAGDDLDRAIVLQRIGLIVLQDIHPPRPQEALSAFSEGFRISVENNFMEAIGYIGSSFAQLLAMANDLEGSEAVFAMSEAVFEELKETEALESLAKIRENVRRFLDQS